MSDLKPCPFCGNHGVTLISGRGMFDRVRCGGCGSTGPWFDGHPIDAVDMWNHAFEAACKSQREACAEAVNLDLCVEWVKINTCEGYPDAVAKFLNDWLRVRILNAKT